MAFPLLAAGALLAPLVGGAMSLAGGALSVTGGLVHAASTAAGMSWDIGKGVAGAVGGLTGSGKSGNVEEEPRAPDPLGGKALPPGTKLNSAGVIVYDKGSSRGGQIIGGQMPGMTLEERIDSIGPVDRGDASPLQRILDHVIHISTNTDRISAGIGLMVAGQAQQTQQQSVQENLDQSETGGGKQAGFISKGLSKTWGGIKNTLSDVGAGLKMALKAIALGGVFVLYRKYRENIKEWMAGIFETFSGWYDILKDSDDPWATAWEGIKTWGEKTFKTLMSWIEEKSRELFNFIYKTVTEFADKILWGDKGAAAVAAENPAHTSATASLASLSATYGNLGFMTSSGETVDAKGNELLADVRGEVNKAAKKKWASMYNMSRKSDWAIQWTDIPYMHAGLLNWDMFKSDPTVPLSIGEKVLISSILNSKPIVGGDIMEQADLSDPLLLNKKLGISEGMSKENRTGILENAAKASSLRWLEQNRTTGLDTGQEFNTSMAHEILSGHIKGFVGDILEFLAPDAIDLYKNVDKDIEKLKQLSIGEYEAVPLSERAAIKRLEKEFYEEGLNGKSISTHDHHVEELLKPVSKAFADGKQTPSVVMAPDNRNQSVTKLGDTYSGGLSSRVQDNTALMLAYTKNLNSTTGQFA